MNQKTNFFAVLGLWLLLLTLPFRLTGGEAPAAQEPGVTQEINSIITARLHPYLKQSDFSNRTQDLDTLYKLFEYKLLWLGHNENVKNLTDALDLLKNSANQGLDPEDYDAEKLQNRFKTGPALAPTAYKDLALLDTAVSIAVLRYVHDLHYGRVNPQGINFNLQLREKKLLDLPILIKDSLTLQTISKLDLLAEPKLQQYQKLKSALASYRQNSLQLPQINFSLNGKLRPRQSHPQLAELAKYLVSLGDLPANFAFSETDKKPKITPELAAGIKHFQQRHGMSADGTLGPGTIEALNVPAAKRIEQIELAMERLRWLPEMENVPRSIIVNIPAFQLWAIEDGAPTPNVTNMRVVVGKALKNQTPVLMANMSFIEFAPYWNVPKNILKDEILPKLSRKSGFLASQNMEIVSNFGNSAKPVALNNETIGKLKNGQLRIRQRPGKGNSLGKVKFIFPNKDDVYLHDTPANSLFSRSRRDFSHGCVRVENPKALAEFALRNQGKWNSETIKKAMQNPANRRVDLEQPIPVLFFYTTAFVDQNNELTFYPDIYSHDQVLVQALEKNADLSDQAIFVSTAEKTKAPDVMP